MCKWAKEVSKVMKIASIRKTFVDEWVAAEVTKVDKADVPAAGEVITHSPDKQEVYQAVKAYLARCPTARTFIFLLGIPFLRAWGLRLPPLAGARDVWPIGELL